MYILKVRENANSPWQLIDVLVGPRGEKGYTPVKGVDYFTQEDIDFIVAEVEKGNYATVEYVDQQIENIPEVDLSNYYTKEQVDTAVKNVEVDLTGYATEEYVENAVKDVEVDLTGYATETYVNTAISKIPTTDLTGYAKTADLAKVATSGNYNDLTNLPTIPSTTGLATEEYVDNAVKNVDLTNYALKTDIPDTTGFALKTEIPSVEGLASEDYVDTAISNIPKTDLTNYYTKNETDTAINNAKPDLTNYATQEYVSQKIAEAELDGSDVDLSSYYTKSEVDALIPSTTGFITMADVEAKGYLTEHQDLSAYALKTEIPSLEGYAKTTDIPDTTGFALKTEIPDVSGYALKTEIPDTSNFTTMSAVEAKGYQTASDVETAINNALANFINGEEVAY